VQKKHHVFLVPGFFGFTHLGAFEYWGHVRTFMVEHFAERGLDVEVTAVGSHPTSSLIARAERLANTIRATADPTAAIHLIGHSSGGLDARLLVAPGVELSAAVEDVASRVRSVITIASPHRGTPLASFFTNLSGPRLLGTAARLLGRGIGQPKADAEDLPPDARAQLSKFLVEVGRDQALIAQLTPELMELFNATARDRPGVRYACVLAKVPPSRFGVRGPISVANRAIFALMHQLTTKEGGTDGVVPTEHQRWGEELFVAAADHLDVLGHFDGGPAHLDWFHSGSAFTRMDFELLWRRVSRVIEDEAESEARRAFDSKRARRLLAAIAVGATVVFGSLALWAVS
jgi:hypothetical protein